jgi:uncharacterized protein
LAVEAQGLSDPSGAPGLRGRSALPGIADRLGTIQLDAVNVLARTQFVVPFARIGPFEPARMLDLVGPGGNWFEYWGHAASLMPISLYPLFRHRMTEWRTDALPGVRGGRRRAWREANAEYLAAVLRDVEQNGPLTAGQLADPRRRVGEWWDRRSDGRRALEFLFADGVLAAWRNRSFERIYDLSERVIPPASLAAPVPSVEEAQRELIAIAARCSGVATTADLADYFWVPPRAAKLRVAELVEAGRLRPITVEGWAEPGYVVDGAAPSRPRRRQASLLSPFDSLIWTRRRTERLFNFRYRIEIYVPKDLRTHGYYVLPLLQGDQLVARFGLKSDRAAGHLRVTGAHLEPGADAERAAAGAAGALSKMADWLGLNEVVVEHHGDLATRLLDALAHAAS